MKETLWNGFKRIDFEFEGREAILVFPQTPNKNKKIYVGHGEIIITKE